MNKKYLCHISYTVFDFFDLLIDLLIYLIVVSQVFYLIIKYINSILSICMLLRIIRQNQC